MRKVMNTFVTTGALLILFIIVPTLTAHAESQDKESTKLFEVTTSYLTMRTAPEEGAAIVGHLVEGNKLRTFEEFNGWVKTFYDGQPVWVKVEHLHLLEKGNPDPTANNKTKNEEPEQKSKSESEAADDSKQNKSEEVAEESVSEHISINHITEDEEELPIGYAEPKQVQISESAIILERNTLDGYHIILDAGHGGKDSGATNKGILEKDINLATAKKVAKRLTEAGADVTLTRKNDTFISLENRVEKSNSQNTDVFLSIHYNYFTNPEASGINTFYYNQNASGELANSIQRALVDQVDMKNRGVGKADYYVLAHNKRPSVLIELGFMTNPSDLEKIQTDAYQDSVAKAITDGLVNYFK